MAGSSSWLGKDHPKAPAPPSRPWTDEIPTFTTRCEVNPHLNRLASVSPLCHTPAKAGGDRNALQSAQGTFPMGSVRLGMGCAFTDVAIVPAERGL